MRPIEFYLALPEFAMEGLGTHAMGPDYVAQYIPIEMYKVFPVKMSKYVKHGRLDILERLDLKSNNIPVDAMSTAVAFNQFEILDYFIERGGMARNNLYAVAIRSGNADMVQYLLDKKIPFEAVDALGNPNPYALDGIIERAVADNHFEVVKLMHDHGYRLNDGPMVRDAIIIAAVDSNNYELFKYIWDMYGPLSSKDQTKFAIKRSSNPQINQTLRQRLRTM